MIVSAIMTRLIRVMIEGNEAAERMRKDSTLRNDKQLKAIAEEGAAARPKVAALRS